MMSDDTHPITIDARRERERGAIAEKRLAFEVECTAFRVAIAKCRAECSAARQKLL